ncbi:transcription factor AP-1 [Trichonephila clavata]|uniref:Transcription factor AP-1 n=1 Tax=Trichonephila clavata TaxID=2740835 RepID=A0A8X6LAS0_TRICU|nr:transcription factor AP-1 [Trichonephila clavata]
MDTTFYDDSRFRGKEENMMLKRPMTLDLGAKSPKRLRVNSLLTSPDLNMLKLGSPELEKLIMAQHSSTFGSTQNQCMYPAKAEEREHPYNRDFTDALSSLQHVTATNNLNVALYQQPQQSMQPDLNLVNVSNSSNNCNIIPPSSIPCSTSMVESYEYQQPLSSINMNCNPMVSSTMNSNCYAPNGYYSHEPIVSIKEEPQTVPCMGGSPPQSPIDMEDQERLKLERKRLRNRIAASKCRRRKLERIARLEDKVQHLKSENLELMNNVTRLRECICQLKQQVMDHVRSGCEILVNPYPPDL